jgi:PAS domain S-box-containing protein
MHYRIKPIPSSMRDTRLLTRLHDSLAERGVRHLVVRWALVALALFVATQVTAAEALAPTPIDQRFELTSAQLCKVALAAVLVVAALVYWSWRLGRISASRTRDQADEKERLRLSEERLRYTLDATNDGLWDWNLSTGVVYWSPRSYTMLGYDPDEFSVTYEVWRSLIHPDDLPTCEPTVQASLETGEPFVIEFRYQRKDGSWQWILGRGRCVERDANGNPLRMLGTHLDLTERKQAEEALRESEERFRLLNEFSPVGMFRTDEKGAVLYTNPQWQRITGLTLEESIGFGWTRALHPDDKGRILEDWSECLREEKGYSGEFRFLTASGEVRWVSTSTAPIRSVRGKVVGHVGINQEVTERKRVEAERARLIDILEATSDFVSTATPDGRLSYLNRAGKRMLGWPEDETFTGRHIPDAHPDWAYHLVETKGIPAAIAHSVWEGETALLRSDGAEVPVSQAIMAHKSPAGEVEYLSTIIRDISERKTAEMAIIAERNKAQAYLEVANVIFVVLDAGGTVTLINRKGCDLLGYREEEILGKSWFDHFLPTEMQEQVKEVFHQIVNDDLTPVEHYENPVRTRDGGERMIAWHNTILRGDQGEVLGTLSCGEDVTERRQLEEQYRQAQKMEAIGQLAGGVAHDFNNLLQVIQGNTEMALNETGLQSRVRDELDEVARATSRAATLVRQLLAFSRRQLLKLEHLALDEVVHELARMLKRVITENIALNIRSVTDLKVVNADRGQIEQVVINLCVNARDAMPDGGELTISIENAELDEAYCEDHAWARPGRFVLLRVVDTGCGLDAETVSRIFEPFFTTKAAGQGTGLGLATVYGIVRQHDGILHVESELDVGSTFKVYFPAVEAVPETPKEKIVARPQGGTETILLAEDDTAVRELALRVLERAGYTVLTAEDGEEAIRVFNANVNAIDLAFLDVVMPKLGGRDVFTHIQKIRPKTRVLFASGYTTELGRTDFVLDEDIQLIRKPCQSDDLLRKIREVLDS